MVLEFSIFILFINDIADLLHTNKLNIENWFDIYEDNIQYDGIAYKYHGKKSLGFLCSSECNTGFMSAILRRKEICDYVFLQGVDI